MNIRFANRSGIVISPSVTGYRCQDQDKNDTSIAVTEVEHSIDGCD